MKRIKGSGAFCDYLRELRRSGYVLEGGGSRHWKIYKCRDESHDAPHCKGCVFTATASATPSDPRALRNLRADIRRGGWNSPRRDMVKT